MQSIANIKSILYLKSRAAQISEDLEMNGNQFVITQNGEASMVCGTHRRTSNHAINPAPGRPH